MSLLGALSAIREIVVSKIFDFLLDKMGSSEVLQLFATEKQVYQEIENLQKELKKLRAVLDDAEERQIKDLSLKIWLTDLQILAYDLDDILDEFETETCRRNLMMERRGSSNKQARLISDSYDVVMFNRDMMSKIRDVTVKLKDLLPQKNRLHLRMIGGMRSNKIEGRHQPTSVEIETHVYGRDRDKEIIVDLLKSDDEADFMIPIVGMGGIGKTTLAQLVYNDATIQNLFDVKAWVCVSDEFDIMRITKEILRSVTSKSGPSNDLNKLQEKLKKKLSKKKFLIVLDDVWNENYHNWTILQSPFLTRKSGSKIIVTTRNLTISSMMGASHAHSLEVLSEDDCLNVFAQHALGASDFGGHPHLKEVAKKVVKKCKGLPLAAKTLGGLLRTNVDRDAWNDILESDIWTLSEDQSGIIPALQLSYHHLPKHLKRCFAYCSILPKDYEFTEEMLILLWRAEGLLREVQDKECIEDLGHKSFRDLLSRSLLQRSNKNASLFVMHDLINDLAQSVAGDICFRIEGDKKISKYTRHLSYIAGKYDGIKKFRGISEAHYLRTFLPLGKSMFSECFLTNHLLMNLLPNMKCLRVLSLERYRITMLSELIGDLKHLRYLNFSYTLLRSLPESISTLYNLEILLLKGCRELEKLPSKMENLVNLCHLNIDGASRLVGMQNNFGTLTNLRTLTNFVLGKGNGYQIRELKNLLNIKGQLCISGLENVTDTQDAWEAALHNKSRLVKLELAWSPVSMYGGEQVVEERVLNLLQPSTKLEELTIKCYCGVTFPNWVRTPPFDNLTSLCLEDCRNCILLPSIGQLPLLEKVIIMRFDSVRDIGVELFGSNTPNAFPSLQILQFKNMSSWENWIFPEVDEEAKEFPFPRLRQLSIRNCPKLVGIIPEYLPSLENLEIYMCPKLRISIQRLPKLSLILIGCREVVYKGLADDTSSKRVCFMNIPKFTCGIDLQSSVLESVKVESLEINDCLNNWEMLTPSMSVGNLVIKNCKQPLSIGAAEEGEQEELMMDLKIPSSIGEMTIRRCPKLKKLSTNLHSLTSLTTLTLHECPNLIGFSKNNWPTNLKNLKIGHCANLVYVWNDEGNQIMEATTSSCLLLERLNIYNCSSLVGLSSRGDLPTTKLKQLKIQACLKLAYIAHKFQHDSSLGVIELNNYENIKCLPISNLKVLCLQNCENLQALSGGIHNFNYLEELRISDCSRLLMSFPEQGIPTNLKKLQIEGPNICKQLMEWGLHRLTCLKSLFIANWCPDSDALSEIGMMLPCSLISLTIYNFPNLKILSSHGFHNLTSLKNLSIENCPKLETLSSNGFHNLTSLDSLLIRNCPKLETLSSNGFHNLTSLEKLQIDNCPNLKSLLDIKDTLSSLMIRRCPEIKERYLKDKGPEWSNIANIPCIDIRD